MTPTGFNYNFNAASMTAETNILGKTNKNTPIVYYTGQVKSQLDFIVASVPTEIGWLGLVDELDSGDFLITELFIPRQEVSATTTEIEAQDMAVLAMELLDGGLDPQKLRYWGHSHVNMAVHPSVQDESQLDDYLEHADWFIRGIYNKAGDSKVDVFDTRSHLLHQCVQNNVYTTPLTKQMETQITSLIHKNVKRQAIARRKMYQTQPYLADSPLNKSHALRNKRLADQAMADTWGDDYLMDYEDETEPENNTKQLTLTDHDTDEGDNYYGLHPKI